MDLRLANVQKPLVKVRSALFESTDTLLAIRASPDKFPGAVRSENLAKYVTYNADALALLRHVHVEMSYHGRNIIKPNLNMEYSASCGSQVPINGFLFGDELQSQLNNIKASNKIGHTTTTKPSYRHHGDSWKLRAKLLTKVESLFSGTEAGLTGHTTTITNSEKRPSQ